MAWIHDSVFSSGTTTSLSCEMPVHESGDLLIYFASNDTNNAITAPAGWTNLQDDASGSVSFRMGHKTAASSSETLSIASSSSRAKSVLVVTVKGNGTLSINTSASSSTEDTTMPFTGISSASTSSANCLVFQAIASDGGNPLNCYLPYTSLTASDATNSGLGVAYLNQVTSGSVDNCEWWGQLAEQTKPFMVAIADSSFARAPAYCDPTLSVGTIIHPLNNTAGILGATFKTSAPLDITSMNSYTIDFDSLSVYSDSGPNPYLNSLYQTIVPQTAAGVLDGNEYIFSPTHDLSTGYLFTTTKGVLHTDMARDLGDSTTPGYLIVVGSSTTNYKAWSVATRDDNSSDHDGRTLISIEPGQSEDTTWFSNGTYNPAATDRVMLLWHNPTGPGTFTSSLLLHVEKLAFAGGGDAARLGIDDIETVANNYVAVNSNVVKRNGSAFTVMVPLQFGGGDPLYLELERTVFQVPQKSNDSLRIRNNHIDSGAQMFTFKGVDHGGGVEDVIIFRDCVFTTETRHSWVIDSASASGADVQFPGCSVVGFDVTLDDAYSYDDMKFLVPTLTGTSVNITNSTLSIADDEGLSLSGTPSVTGCTITGSPNPGEAPFASSVAFADTVFSDILVTATPEGGHGIRIAATGTFTHDGVAFSGFPDRDDAFFDIRNDINGSTEIITTTHNYTTGDPVVYNKDGQTGSCGLTEGNVYYVQSLSGTTLKLHTTKEDALADTGAVDISSAGVEEEHRLTNANAAIFNDSGGAVTINLVNGSNAPSVRNSNGSTTTFVQSVTASVTVRDSSSSAIEDARVLVLADTGGPLPSGQIVTSVVAFGNSATCFATAHGLKVGDKFVLKGATPESYNTIWTVQTAATDSFSFTVTGSPGNASGTISLTGVVLEGLTNASGVLSDTAFSYTADQPVIGRARKSSASPYYKTADFAGTLTSSGFSVTVTMADDE